MNNEHNKYFKLHCSPTVTNSLKFGLSNSGVRSIGGGEVNFSNSSKISKVTYGEEGQE